MVEINCPADCTYLQGEFFHRDKVFGSVMSSAMSREQKLRFFTGLSRFGEAAWTLEAAMVEWMGGPKAILDREAAEALQILRRSYETEVRGILYQDTSPNPLVQSLVRRLRERVEELRRPDPKGPPVVLTNAGAIVEMLLAMETEIEYYMSSSADESRAYVSSVWRRHPQTRSGQGPGLLLASS